MDHSSVSEYNGSEIITFTVAGMGISSWSAREVASIKSEVDEKVEVGNADVRGEALRLVRKYPGSYNIDQICSIYEDLCENWYYASDPRGIEYFQYANQTLNYEKAGDCDDFAILMAALIENVGGSTRIILAYGPGGHAYTEVYLGEVGAEDRRVERIIDRLRDRYKIAEVNTHKDLKNDDVWLNLDWGDDPRKGSYPGGPFYTAEKHVVLQVRDEYNITAVNPPNEPPLAIIAYEPEEPSARQKVTFDASRSRDSYGTIIGYEWDFGDGMTAVGPTVEHTYSEGGVFTVNLIVIDNEGAESSNTTEIQVNKPPVARFSHSIRELGEGHLIRFNASESIDDDGRITNYEWDFGDGATAKGKIYSHYYLASGTFTVNLTVIDDDGTKSTRSVPIKINEPPVPGFSYDPKEPNAGDTITLDASQSKDNDGSIVEYRWDFGDENTAEGILVAHNYSKGGTFSVKLEVKDDNNATKGTESTIRVNAPPVASFIYTPAEPVAGDLIIFTSDSKDEDGIITSYEWNFGDGYTGSSVSEVDHTYHRYGSFTVTLTVADDKGAISTEKTEAIVVRPAGPIILQVGPIGSSSEYTKIQDAIDAANSGDTIEVQSGTYYEQVVVNKRLNLIGLNTGNGKPIVDSAGGVGNAITLIEDGIRLEGFEAINSDNGISLHNVTDNIIKDNIIRSNRDHGIILSYSNNNNIIKNYMNNNNGSGISLRDSNNNNIMENNMNNNNGSGIVLFNS